MISKPYFFEVFAVHLQPLPLESFISYLIRLAEANGFLSLHTLSRFCFPQGDHKFTSFAGDFPRLSFGLLPTLTQCSEARLQATTFYHLGKKFERILEPRTMAQFLTKCIAKYLRYCPKCLAENNYYSLLWRFVEIKGCLKHECELLDSCGHCGQTVPLVPNPLRIGFCPACDGDLRSCVCKPLKEGKLKSVQAYTDDFTFLLMPHPCETTLDSPAKFIGEQLARWRQVRKLKIADIANCLNIPLGTIYYLEQGSETRKEKFLWYFRYADFLCIPLRTLFISPLLPQDTPSSRDKLVEKVEQALIIFEQQHQQATLEKLAEMICVSDRVLTEYSEVNELIAKHREKQRPKVEARWIERMQEAAQSLSEEGNKVNGEAIGRKLGRSPEGLKKNRTIAFALDKIIKKYDTRQTLSTPPTKAELTKVETATKNFLRKGESISITKIGKELNIDRCRLSHCQPALQIIHKYQAEQKLQEENELLEKIKVAKIEVEATGVKPSVNAICKIAGKTEKQLYGYSKVKDFLFEEIVKKHHQGRLRGHQIQENQFLVKAKIAQQELISAGKEVTPEVICEMINLSKPQMNFFPLVRAFLTELTSPKASGNSSQSFDELKK